MKHLKIEQIISLAEMRGDTLSANGINNFIESIVMDLLESLDIDVMDGFPTTKDDFKESSMLEADYQIPLSTDISLDICYNAYCQYEYNTCDETDNGGGKKGDLIGVEFAWLDIKTIMFYTPDGSVIDMSANNTIKEFLHTNINIE